MNTNGILALRFAVLLLVTFPGISAIGQTTAGEVVVRVDDTSGSHCIDATTEKVTVFVRRVFVEKSGNWFTEDKKAGVLVRSQITGDKTTNQSKEQVDVQVPSVSMVSIKTDPRGRVSLGLEYPVASGLALKQSDTLTKTMDLYVNLAKAKGRTTFGSILDLAGQALTQLPIPPNPYTQASSKFLKFANSAIDSSIKNDENDQIAHVGLQFNEGAETDLKKCESAGNERTGAIAVLRSVGVNGAQLIPVTNTESQFCFRYSSGSTYELLAAKKNGDGTCPSPQFFAGVSNDYVMLLISAQPIPKAGKSVVTPDVALNEARSRCELQKLPAAACGLP